MNIKIEKTTILLYQLYPPLPNPFDFQASLSLSTFSPLLRPLSLFTVTDFPLLCIKLQFQASSNGLPPPLAFNTTTSFLNQSIKRKKTKHPSTLLLVFFFFCPAYYYWRFKILVLNYNHNKILFSLWFYQNKILSFFLSSGWLKCGLASGFSGGSGNRRRFDGIHTVLLYSFRHFMEGFINKFSSCSVTRVDTKFRFTLIVFEVCCSFSFWWILMLSSCLLFFCEM